MSHRTENLIKFFIFFLILPIFIQISDGIYHQENLRSVRSLFYHPFPISFFIVPIFIIIFYKNLYFIKDDIFWLLVFIFITILLFSSFSENVFFDKIIMLLQFFFVWLGYFIGKSNKVKIDFYFIGKVLFSIIIIHLLYTFLNNKLILLEDFVFFSIYQNIQYVNTSLIFLGSLSIINFFYKRGHKLTTALSLILLLYAFLSYSLNSIILAVANFIFFQFYFIFKNKIEIKFFSILCLLLLSVILIFKFTDLKNERFITKDKNFIENKLKIDEILKGKLPDNITQRYKIWSHYYNYFESNPKALITGSDNLSLNKKYQSAHNFFLEGIYRFGILITIPYFFLLIYLIKSFITYRKNFEIRMSLVFLMIYLFLENSFKISIIQPYSGLISFFMIGYFNKINYNYFYTKFFD